MRMKTTLLTAILALGLLPGITNQSDARPVHRSYVFLSGHQRCGTPIYSVRYLSGYTHCGRPIWRVRAMSRVERHHYLRAGHASRQFYSYQRGCRSW